MVKLRLKRAGKKRSAFYRIVASDARVQRDGAYIELIGAQPTDTVRNILSDAGVMTEYHNVKQEAKKAAPKKATTAKPKVEVEVEVEAKVEEAASE
ncbi:hypothetical protein FQR65_LT18632 [Abscondita terminalis]|nr:hypothetical protein FQR65_LT18632 [Abscondita terminalis]